MEHDDYGQKALFYIENRYLNIEISYEGKLVKNIPNLLKTRTYLPIRSRSNYIVNARLEEDASSILGYPITREENDREILVLFDEEFNCLKHIVIDFCVMRMACNDLNIICIDDDEQLHYFDIDLELMADESFNKVKETVGSDDLDEILMNNRSLFVLSKKSELLRIFELSTFDLVREIDVKADKMKLVSNSHIVLFDWTDQVIYLYNQSGQKLDKVYLEIIGTYYVNADKSSTILLFNKSHTRSINFHNIFNVPIVKPRKNDFVTNC
jgi:hypothetical protein